eukprot:3268425-Pyramimonas_sp.AAC.1
MSSFPSSKLELPMFAPDSPEPWHHTYTPVAGTWVWAWPVLLDEGGDDGPDLRRESTDSFNGSEEPTHDI